MLSRINRDSVSLIPQRTSMIKQKVHRITDWNQDIYGLEKQTSFEAAFSIANDGALCLQGKIINADNREIFCSSDIRELMPDKYQVWDPKDDLAEFIEAIELETIDVEPTYFQTPCLELSLEVKGPIANPKVFGITITMSLNFSILGMYEWKDTGNIHITILCQKDHLLEFAKGLKADLLELQEIRVSH